MQANPFTLLLQHTPVMCHILFLLEIVNQKFSSTFVMAYTSIMVTTIQFVYSVVEDRFLKRANLLASRAFWQSELDTRRSHSLPTFMPAYIICILTAFCKVERKGPAIPFGVEYQVCSSSGKHCRLRRLQEVLICTSLQLLNRSPPFS